MLLWHVLLCTWSDKERVHIWQSQRWNVLKNNLKCSSNKEQKHQEFGEKIFFFFPFFEYLVARKRPPLTYMCDPGSRRREAKERLEEDENWDRLTVELAKRHERRQVRTKKEKKNPAWEMSSARNKTKGEKKVWQKSGVGKRQQASDWWALEQLVNHSPPGHAAGRWAGL